MARVIFYALGGGLGHLNRSLAIIRHLRRAAPHTEPLVITNSPFCHLALAAGVPVLRLPSAFEQGLLSQPDLGAQLTRAVLETLMPIDAMIVDAAPGQIAPELLTFLARSRFHKVCVLRGESVPASFEPLAPFDRIFYPFPAHMAPQDLPAHVTPTGYIVGRQNQDVLTRTQARLRLGLAPDGEEPVVLSFHAASPAETMGLFRQVKAASELLDIGHSLRLSTPQVLPGVEYFYPHLVSIYPIMDVLEAADLVICAPGYNAHAEISCLQRKAIYRPLDRPYDHQRERAVDMPVFEAGTSDVELAALMQTMLATPAAPRRANAADFKGGEVLADAIANAMATV